MFIVKKLSDNSLKTVIVRMFHETVSGDDVSGWADIALFGVNRSR